MARRDLVSEYFNEPIFYGGLICTRAEAIADMEAQGLNQRCIDRWMFGAESAPVGTALVVDEGENYDGEVWGPIGVTPAARGEGENESIAHYFEAAVA